MATSLQLRRDIATLVRQANGDLAVIWRSIESAQDAAAALYDILPSLVDAYGSAASLVAAEWYDERRLERAARGSFAAIPAEIPNSGTEPLVGWALSTATDLAALESLVVMGVQRRIANHSRLTVTRSAVADRQAQGWRRVGIGECRFCSMLLSRGAVYSEATADFQAHDGCQCGAEPAF